MSENSQLISALNFLTESSTIELGLAGLGDFDLASEKRDALVQIFQAIEQSDSPAAVEALNCFELDEKPKVRNFFSANMLIEKKREWTGHGINRTFRFWSSAEKHDYLLFTAEVLKALRMKYEACLGYGSVLSIIRDQDLIPHDDDLDIIVSMPGDSISSYKSALEEVEAYLTEMGFSVRGEYLAHRHVTNNRFILDVFLGLEEDGYVSWHPGPRKLMRKESVFPARTEPLYGIDCFVPKNSEAYLASIYGTHWRTPLPGWTHDFDPVKYADWFWPKPT